MGDVTLPAPGPDESDVLRWWMRRAQHLEATVRRDCNHNITTGGKNYHCWICGIPLPVVALEQEGAK